MENDCSTSYDHVRNTQVDDDHGQWPTGNHDHQRVIMDGQDQIKSKESDVGHTGIHRWEKAMISFTILKDKVAQTLVIRHFDPDHPPVIVVYASK